MAATYLIAMLFAMPMLGGSHRVIVVGSAHVRDVLENLDGKNSSHAHVSHEGAYYGLAADLSSSNLSVDVTSVSQTSDLSLRNPTNSSDQARRLAFIPPENLKKEGFINNGQRGSVSLYIWTDPRNKERKKGIPVAVKTANTPDTQWEIDNEIEVMSVFSDEECPSVVRAYGQTIIGGQNALVMEYIDGLKPNNIAKEYIQGLFKKDEARQQVLTDLVRQVWATAECIKKKGISVHDKTTANFILPKDPKTMQMRGIIWLDMGITRVKSSIEKNARKLQGLIDSWA